MKEIQLGFQPPGYFKSLLSHCHRRTYPKGVEIIHPGDPADVLYAILQGSVAVTMDDEEGKEIILSYLNPGEFIGEMGLFLPQAVRSVSVRARTDAVLAEISYARLEQLFERELKAESRDILFAIGYQLTQRLLHTSRKVGHLAFYDVTGRVAKTLMELAREPDALTHPEGMQIRVTRQEIGRIVGCSREMAGRVLKNLEEQHLIRVDGKTIVVLGAHA